MCAKHKVEHSSKLQLLEVQMQLHVPSHVAIKSGGGSKSEQCEVCLSTIDEEQTQTQTQTQTPKRTPPTLQQPVANRSPSKAIEHQTVQLITK